MFSEKETLVVHHLKFMQDADTAGYHTTLKYDTFVEKGCIVKKTYDKCYYCLEQQQQLKTNLGKLEDEFCQLKLPMLSFEELLTVCFWKHPQSIQNESKMYRMLSDKSSYSDCHHSFQEESRENDRDDYDKPHRSVAASAFFTDLPLTFF